MSEGLASFNIAPRRNSSRAGWCGHYRTVSAIASRTWMPLSDVCNRTEAIRLIAIYALLVTTAANSETADVKYRGVAETPTNGSGLRA